MTTTMLESFDAQMFDYQNDLDFSMHVSSTDPWFQDEAVMEDDLHTLHPHNIEVDMEPHDEDHHEYEMEDDSEPHELDASHILDVDFDGTPSSVVLQTTDTDPSNLNSPDPIHTSINLTKSSVADSDPHFFHAEPSDSPQPSHSALISDLVSSTNTPLLPSKEEASPSTPSFHHADVSAGGHLTSPALDPESDQAPESDSEVVGAEQQHLDQHGDRTAGIRDNGEIISATGGTELSHCGGVVSSENVPDVLRPFEGQEERVEYDGSAGDPHEISEGVYIDPPPAVLLSFPVANHPDISLFNTPPRAEATSLAHAPCPGFAVLLAHLPTLYYEPISSVFEALRQEEHLDAILELLDGELVFDAYDLQLTIHEDSIYAREISLHDLNVLHDGLNISGSLRLKIYAISPRFIIQYHMLQEQIARLTTADFGEAVATSLAVDQDDLLREMQAQLGNEVNAAEEQTGHYQDEPFTEYADSIDNTADEPATRGPEEHATCDQNKHQQQEQDEKGKSDPLAQSQDSTDQKEAQHGHEARIIDSKETDDEQEGDEKQEDKEQKCEEQEDPTYALEHTDNFLSTPVKPVSALEVSETADTDTPAPAPVDDEFTEYDEYTEHDELGDGEYGEIPFNDDNLQGTVPVVPHRQSETPYASNSTGTESATSDLLELVPDVERTTEAESHPHVASSSELPYNVSNNQDPSKLEQFPAVNKSERKPSPYQNADQVIFNEVEPWDDDPDEGDGDPDTTWEAEHETESNQSSITLSSKMSSKRSISEIELEHDHNQSSPTSPGPKRLRIE